MEPLKLADVLVPRPQPKGIDAYTLLEHFAIITFAIPPERFKGMIDDRFELDTVEIDGQTRALLSVVPFIDKDFTSAVFPFFKFRMGQTNYRIYVIDKRSGERAVWFLGTTLDSWTVVVPRYLWKLPWHPGKVRFSCEQDAATGLYKRYEMSTQSEWAPAHLKLSQTADMPWELPGFPDIETGRVCLTHPLTGYYFRRDGKLGSYKVWHEQLQVQPAQWEYGSFKLLEKLNLASRVEQQKPHSVLVQPATAFTVYLPPHEVGNP